MRLLFYTSQDDGRIRWLGQRLAGLWPLGMEFCPDLDTLKRGFRQFESEMVLAVILTASQEELQEVLAMKSWLKDKPLVLILPARDKDTVTKGQVLAPRFLTDVQSDFREIFEVLSKMIEIYLHHDRGQWQRKISGIADYV